MAKKVMLCFVILALALALAFGMSQMKPVPKQRIKERTIAMVEVMTITKDSLQSEILSHGTVQSKQRSEISSEVSGLVIFRAKAFADGSFVKKGELLLRIDKTDYDAAVAEARSVLLQSQLTLKDKKASFGNKSLPAQQAEAAQDAAQKQLQRAQRDLRNTQLRAAFNGVVQRRTVEVGQFISKGQQLFNLSGTDMAEVRLPVNRKDIEHIDNKWFQKSIETAITLTARIGSHGQHISRQLNKARLQAAVDEQTRVFYLNVDIPDPYNFQPQNQQRKPLALGTFVNARIHSRPIENAVRLPLELIQQDSSVYLYVDGKLQRQSITIGRKEAHHAIITGGLNNGDKLVTTQLPVMYDNMTVRLAQPASTMEDESEYGQ